MDSLNRDQRLNEDECKKKRTNARDPSMSPWKFSIECIFSSEKIPVTYESRDISGGKETKGRFSWEICVGEIWANKSRGQWQYWHFPNDAHVTGDVAGWLTFVIHREKIVRLTQFTGTQKNLHKRDWNKKSQNGTKGSFNLNVTFNFTKAFLEHEFKNTLLRWFDASDISKKKNKIIFHIGKRNWR